MLLVMTLFLAGSSGEEGRAHPTELNDKTHIERVPSGEI